MRGKYLFTRKTKLITKITEPVLKLVLQLEKDRVKFNKNKALNSLKGSAQLMLTIIFNWFLVLVNVEYI